MDLEVVAHLAHGFDGTQVFAFLADQQLHHRIARVLCELQRVVVLRHHGRLVQAEHCLDAAAPCQKVTGAIDELFQDPARVFHDLVRIRLRVQVGTADFQSPHERVQQFDEIDALFFFLARCRREWIRLVIHPPVGALVLVFRDRAAEKCVFELLVACHFLFIKKRNAGLEFLFGYQALDVVGNNGHRLGWRHGQALALIQRHPELELAHAQPVAVEQAARVALADRRLLVIDKDAVGAGVDQVKGTRLEVDCGMTAGKEVVGIGQYPVVFQRSADGTAVLAELAHTITAKNLLVVTDDF